MTDHTEVLATLTDEQRAAVDAVIAQKDATIEELRLVDATLQVMIAECRAQKTCSSQGRKLFRLRSS